MCRDNFTGKSFVEHYLTLQRRRVPPLVNPYTEASRPESQATLCSCWMESLRLMVFVFPKFTPLSLLRALTISLPWTSRLRSSSLCWGVKRDRLWLSSTSYQTESLPLRLFPTGEVENVPSLGHHLPAYLSDDRQLIHQT